MNSLPNELLLSIFGQLTIKDLIQCRMVCKRFMALCGEVKVTEVIISNKIEDMKDYWFYSNEQFNHKDAINMRTFATHRSTFKFDKNLKRLHFRGDCKDYELLNLNDMIGIVQLKIDMDVLYVRDNLIAKVVNIKLMRLKILEIDDGDLNCHFHFTTPELEMLKCSEYEFDSIHLHDPKTVRHLEVVFFNENIKIFKNVEHLKVGWGFLPNPGILSSFPHLNTLDINKLDYNDEIDEMESMESLRYLVEQKRNRPGLKVYFQSVDMVDVAKIEEYELTESIFAFQIQNYHLLCRNLGHIELDYNCLMKLVRGTLPDDFYQKYFNVHSVRVNETVKSQRHFVEFLQNLHHLKALNLFHASFDQTFYDDIGRICSLRKLLINGEKSVVNYNFLLTLKLLKSFSTDRDFRVLPIVALWKSLKYLSYTNFYFGKEFISISKYGNVYSFERYRDPTEGPFHRTKIFERSGMCLDDLVSLIHEYEESAKTGNCCV